jgi:hypothetical protein
VIRTADISRRKKLAIAGVLLALVATFAVALPAAGADPWKVDVVGNSGEPVEVPFIDLAPTSAPGHPEVYLLSSVLDEAKKKGIPDWRSAEDIEVPRASAAQELVLTPAEVTKGKPYIYVEGDDVMFENPAGGQKFQLSGSIRIGPRAVLQVAIRVPDEKIRAGDKVTFAAASTAPVNSSTYTWTVNGVRKSGGRTFTQTFKADGRYSIAVEVTNGSLKGYSEAFVQVGEAKKSKKKREGGGKKKDGGETGQTTADDPYSGYPGDTGTGGYGGYGGGGYPGGTGTGTRSPSAPAAPQAPEQKEPVEPVDDGLVQVSGDLVSSSAPAEVIAQAPGGGAPEALQEGSPAKPGGIADWVWVSLGLLALLALGMAAEKRGSRLH